MGFNSVYRSLQEVFPQVDVRILKAVAIEHSKDADAAVESILMEVLPSMSNFSEGPHCNHNSSNPSVGTVESEDQSFSLKLQQVGEEASSGPSKPRSVASEDINDASDANDASYVNSVYLDEALGVSSVSNNHGTNDVHSPPCSETEELKSLAENQEISVVESNQCLHIASCSLIDEDTLVSGLPNDTLHAVFQDLNEPVAYVSNPSSAHEDMVNNAECGLLSENDYSASVDEFNKSGEKGPSQTAYEHEVSVTEMVDIEGESSSTTVVTRSGQICRTDLLENAIGVAKNNKKILFSAMESLINMMGEVELQEKAAAQAKEEAARGGVDILARVENLKHMLQETTEANDMHAGEVYGEKSILATELRELQSRLLNLSEERNKSLAMLDEMHQALEARLAVAEEEKKAAEQEKQVKEESARKALAEQELIMEKVVEESKKLQEEAEENSRLREFLVDRGHVVDALQGEIAVICQDVKLLKEKFDERIPLSKSVSSSQTSCILASSNSSYKSMASDRALEQTESSEMVKKTSPSSSIVDQSLKTWSEEQQAVGGDHKVFSDDDWEMFEDKAEWRI